MGFFYKDFWIIWFAIALSERTYWSFQKHIVRIRLDIYVFYFDHWIKSSAGGPEGINSPTVSAFALITVEICIHYWHTCMHFLIDVIFIAKNYGSPPSSIDSLVDFWLFCLSPSVICVALKDFWIFWVSNLWLYWWIFVHSIVVRTKLDIYVFSIYPITVLMFDQCSNSKIFDHAHFFNLQKETMDSDNDRIHTYNINYIYCKLFH